MEESMNKKKIIVFASGTKDGGGSGFEKLCLAVLAGILNAEIVAVVSNHEHGGVRTRAEKLGIPFIYMPGPWKDVDRSEDYKRIVEESGAEFVSLSGWLKLVSGLDDWTVFNIHPGPLPLFGGAGMYGHHVHEAVMEAYHRGEVTHSAVTMHFVDGAYDRGPSFFEYKVKIRPDDTAETLGARLNAIEHEWQAVITNKVVSGEISWDGKNPEIAGKIVMTDEE